MGIDHMVANMFFLPAAMFVGVPDLGIPDVLRNWSLALVGKVGAIVFVSTPTDTCTCATSEDTPPATES